MNKEVSLNHDVPHRTIWAELSPGSGKVIITIPRIGRLDGLFWTERGELKPAVFVEYYSVNPDVKGQGWGKRLLQILADESRQHEIQRIEGRFYTPESLGALAGALGVESIQFMDHGRIIEMSYDEAMEAAKTTGLNYTASVDLE
ncbi:MAG TPA: GNAT family N-acetyltransferase [Candidatus Saccharimonadales bacterium]|nr:GNAT family N-acetyltransferase [Candidatus Saccharimonadales bacterium]